MRLKLRSQRVRAGLTIGTVSAYVLMYFLAYPQLDLGSAALAVLPVALLGWLGGARLGLLAGALSLPVNALLLNLAAPGRHGWDILLSATSVLGSLALVLIGFLVGRLRDVRTQLTEQLAQRRQAEAALGQSQRRHQVLAQGAQRQAQALTLLDQVHEALASELPLPLVIQTVVEGVARTFGYTLVSLYLLDGETLKLQHQVGYDQVIEQFPVTQGVCGRVVHTGQAVLLEDVRADPAFLGAIEGITSEVCVPLIDQGRVVGVLNVESTQGMKLTEADLHLMLSLSKQVGIALSRARLTADMRESQQRFESAVRYASIGMALVAPDGRWLQVNHSLCDLVGYTEPELLATNFQALTHPDDLETDLGYGRQMLAGERQSYQMEKRYFHKRGHVVWVLLSVSLVRDAQDQPLYFIAQIQNITERKTAEEALGRNAAQLAALYQVSQDIVAQLDLEQVCAAAHHAVEQLVPTQAFFIALLDEARQEIEDAYLFDQGRRWPNERGPLAERGMIAHVIRTGELLWIEDDADGSSQAMGRSLFGGPDDTRSVLVAPLMISGRPIGAISAQHADPNMYTAEHVRALVTLANQVAIAIDHARLFEAERNQRVLAEALREAGAALGASLDFDTVLDRLLEQIERVIPYDAANVMLLDQGRVRVARQRGYEQYGEHVARDIATLAFEISTTANLRRMAETGQPLVIPDTAADPAWVTVQASAHVRSWAGAPIVAQGQVIAFFSLDKAEPFFFRTEHGERLSAFASQAAAALENARLHAEVKALATIDGLTGLPNRRAFDRTREQEMARAKRFGQPLALIVLDIDSFKHYNDTHGHPAGDERLRAVALLLQGIVRSPDFSARYGGEEFAVLLPQTDKPGGLVAAERIRAAAEAAAPPPKSPGAYVPGYTFSMGVAAFPEDAQTADDLLLAADNAELAAKRNGKNRVCAART